MMMTCYWPLFWSYSPIKRRVTRRTTNASYTHTQYALTSPVKIHLVALLGPFYGAIAVPSDTRCRCCRYRRCCGHRCAGSVRQWRRATVATPGEWQCKTGGMRRLAVANGPNIFQMLLVYTNIRHMQVSLKYGWNNTQRRRYAMVWIREMNLYWKTNRTLNLA